MTQPLLRDILLIVMASCMAIGLYRQEERINMLTHSSNVQDERIKMLEDALLLEKKHRSAERPSRGLQENCVCPFAKNENGDWATTDADSLFIFEKGIIIGKKNVGQYGPACNYGNHILSVDTSGDNCPSGDGSVTFGWANTASGAYSAVVGGGYNVASGPTSSISGGRNNAVSATLGSISGGKENVVFGGYGGSISGGVLNTVYGSFGSILGGQSHVLEGTSGTVSSKSNFKNATNATVIETIPAHHPEDRIAALEEHSPFDCTAEEGWCTSEGKRFLFSEGIVVGAKNPACDYGTGTLSVDFKGTNCPSHRGSVTFGKNNQMSRGGSFTVG